jgi:acid phosphatase type 7
LFTHPKYSRNIRRIKGTIQQLSNRKSEWEKAMKMVRGGLRAALVTAAAAAVLVFTSGGVQSAESNNNTWPYAATGDAPVLAVVGDVACQPGESEPSGEKANENCLTPKAPYTSTSLWQSQEATANQIETMKPDLVALLGDLQYQVGQYSDFEQSYDLTFGAFKFLTRPSPGNHEFYDEHSQTGVAGYGYFSYFNGYQVDPTGAPLTTTLADPCPSTMTGCGYPGATTPVAQPIPRSDGQAGHFEESGGIGSTEANPVGVGDGWYSYNLGTWHIISLNIECETAPGGCSNTGSWFAAELAWLKSDLEANHSVCTAAYWHQPTYSPANSISEEGITAQAFWQLLYQYGADLVLNGHDHLYARYRPLDASGNSDPKTGITEFVVGTGGETLDTVVNTTVTSGPGETNMEDPGGHTDFNAMNLVASSGNYWGVMALTLNKNSYAWDFESALLAPVAPSGTPATFSDTGTGKCHGRPPKK